MNVRAAIVSDPRVVDAGAAAQEAAELLTHPNVKSVLVVQGERLVGCVTPESIVAALAAGSDLGAATAGDVADAEVTTIDPDAPVEEALQLMNERDLERMAVIEDGRFLGVLHRGPLVRRLAEDEPASPDESRAKTDASEPDGLPAA